MCIMPESIVIITKPRKSPPRVSFHPLALVPAAAPAQDINPKGCGRREGWGRGIAVGSATRTRLTTETVQGAALSLQLVDDVQRGDGLALGVLGVGDGITDDALEEGLEDTSGLLVDHCAAGLAQPGSMDQTLIWRENLLAEIRFTPPRRARRRIAGLVIPWMLSRRIFR